MGGGALAAVAVDVGTEVAMETVGVMENHKIKIDRPLATGPHGSAAAHRLYQFGGRFSMNACTPSCATSWAMLQAMVCPANW